MLGLGGTRDIMKAGQVKENALEPRSIRTLQMIWGGARKGKLPLLVLES